MHQSARTTVAIVLVALLMGAAGQPAEEPSVTLEGDKLTERQILVRLSERLREELPHRTRTRDGADRAVD